MIRQYLPQLPTIVLGFIAVVIAFQQWRVARSKLKLDLFARRYLIYDATRKFLSEITASAKFTDAHYHDFLFNTSDAGFLFEANILEYLKQIKDRSLDMRLHAKIYPTLPDGEERTRRIDAEAAQIEYLHKQLAEMKTTFAPYMNFAQIK